MRKDCGKLAYSRRSSSSDVESMADRLFLVQRPCHCFNSVGHMDEVSCLFSIPVHCQGFSKRDGFRELCNHPGVWSWRSTGSVDVHKSQNNGFQIVSLSVGLDVSFPSSLRGPVQVGGI